MSSKAPPTKRRSKAAAATKAEAIAASASDNQPRKPRAKTTRCPLDVFKYHDYRAFLSDYYDACKRRKGFSYRAFSRAAGLAAPNYLKLVIAKQRNLTLAMAERFAGACGLGRESSRYFACLVELNQATDFETRSRLLQRVQHFRRYRRAQKLEVAESAYHSTWYLPAVRELALSSYFQEDPEWIAQALLPPIRPLEARQALEKLVQLSLLQRDNATGVLRPSARVVSTGAQTTGVYITHYHLEMLRRAATAILETPAKQRDITSLTLCTSARGFERIKECLKDLRRELIEICETEPDMSQVVQVNLQLFPLSKDVTP